MKWVYEPGEPDMMLALSKKEAKVIAKLLEKQRKSIQKKYDHFLDLHEAGEATDRQQTSMFEYEYILETIDCFMGLEKK